MNNTPSLYERLTAAGIETSNWQSDLYFPANQQTAQIVKETLADGHTLTIRTFSSQVDNRPMYEAFFQFTPFWQARAK
jgi:hypothetical protein